MNNLCNRPTFSRWTRLLLTVIAAGLMSTTISAQTSPAQQTIGTGRGVRAYQAQGVRQFNGQQSSKREPRGYHFAVIGPVGRPSTFVTHSTQVTLTDIVRSAGGLTDDVSPMAKVIRNGRAGLQIMYSPTSTDRLSPGDLVVFNRSSQSLMPPQSANPIRVASHSTSTSPAVLTQSGPVGVAFVGIHPGQPVVLSLPSEMATLAWVLVALKQDASLINTLRVIRTDRSAKRLSPGELPQSLIAGDVIVFNPASIDRARLATAVPLPRPVPLTVGDAGDVGFSPSHPAINSPSELRDVGTQVETDQSVTLPASMEQDAHLPNDDIAPPAVPEPARSFEPSTLPPLNLQSTPASQPIPTPAFPTTSQSTFPTTSPVGLTSPVEANAACLVGIDSSLGEERLFPVSDPQPTVIRASLIENRTSFDPTPTPAAQLPASVETMSSRPSVVSNDFTNNSFHRLAMAGTYETTATNAAGDVATTHALVPAPLDLPAESPSNTTGLAASVLIIAVLCFAASVVWSRMDEATGLPASPALAAVESTSDTQSTTATGDLERLIDNSYPLIEEQTSLPVSVNYHGEEVGRRRIRLDAQHEQLAGPHYATKAPQTDDHQTVSASALFGKSSSASSSLKSTSFYEASPASDVSQSATPPEASHSKEGPQRRFDAAETAGVAATAFSRANADRVKRTGSVLDRVLVNIDREKRG